MRPLSRLALVLGLALTAPLTPAHAQNKVIDVTVDLLERFFRAKDKEKTESSSMSTQISDLDAKIAKFQKCKADLEAAGTIGGRVGGLAARLILRRTCGASDDEDWRKQRAGIMNGPENAAATAGGFQLAEYRNLRDRLQDYLNGDNSSFTKPSLDILKSKQAQLAAAFGMSATGVGAGVGARGPAMWASPDFTWAYIHMLFAAQFLSGATMFEGDYKPGEWTRWQAVTEDGEEKQISERAFIGKPSDGGEWWRIKTIYNSGDSQDTISLEALFKPEPGNELSQQLVRMRGKLPGNSEPQELIVPEQYGMWNMAGSLGRRPTKESIDGATVGTESVTTPAGTFRARHVRYGMGGGTMDWWLDDSAVGGWVKFTIFGDDRKPKYTQELIAKGTGARSELGVTIK